MKQQLKQLETLCAKELGIRNKITIDYGIDATNKRVVILGIMQKSRILIKDVPKFERIVEKISKYLGYTFHKRVLQIHAPICHKALKLLQEKNFSVVDDATV
jgi:hypothetical protein